jgi:hypothetical protein
MRNPDSGTEALAIRVSWGDRRLAAQVLVPGGTSRFSIGPKNCDLTVAQSGRLVFSLERGRALLSLSPDVVGTIRRGDGKALPLATAAERAGALEEEAGWVLPLHRRDAVELQVGALRVSAFNVRAPRAAAWSVDELDFGFLNVLLATGLLAALLVLRLSFEVDAADEEDDATSAELAKLRLVLFQGTEPTPRPSRAAHLETPARVARTDDAQAQPLEDAHPRAHSPAAPSGATKVRAALASLFPLGQPRDRASGGGLDSALQQAMGRLVARAEGPGAGGAGDPAGGWQPKGDGGGGALGVPQGIGLTGLTGLGGIPRGSPRGPRSGRDPSLPRLPTSSAPVVEVTTDAGVACAADGSTEGCLSRDLLRAVIRSHHGQIRYCYESELARHPSLAGRVAVRFFVGPDGAVGRADVQQSTLASATVGACLVSRVRTWRFPASRAGYVVTYPFLFRPAGSEAR